MEKKLPGQEPGKIMHINAAGVLFKDRAILPVVSRKKPIYFEEVRNVKIWRRRGITINLMSFLAALALCLNAAMGRYTGLERVFILLYSVVFLGLAIFYKSVKYKMTLVYRDGNRIDVDVDRFLKDDAKYMAVRINKAVSSNR
ncbi:hypothetical protein HYN59_13575 [Flavobacterium album]|uniref:Uncharacterized protein n=1 Tax=Flavobacterium album TaxID=2175091 RepID=A0A2S1R087_9FLAO|nr:hypothetical protein [Flavobacterium album]AWH86078.1 hypothetical protein HYN59_13575 [Flavobacterium album]